MLQKNTKIWDVNVENKVISKFVETKTNSTYFIWCLDKATDHCIG